MNATEKRATFSLAALFSLRMLGLFMILPIFSAYATHFSGATPLRIGLALGIYGLTQALGQVPFGMLSDHYPRKHIIALGFSIFIMGSMLAAHAHTIISVIIGRAVQGAGAVGSVIIALLTDLTRQEQRSKAMAIIGVIIGSAFFLAMILGPIISPWVGIAGIFWLSAILGVLAIIILYAVVPNPATIYHAKSPLPVFSRFKMLISNPALLSLDIGIFCLHAVLTASFVAVPLLLNHLLHNQHPAWTVYLPTMLLAIVLTFALIGWAEKTRHVMLLYFAAIIALMLAELGLWYATKNFWLFCISLTLFFTAFNVLEANLPSLISRVAPPALKGTAIGIYSTFQFSGIFIGGLLGGWLYGHYNPHTVLSACANIILIWLILAAALQKHRIIFLQKS